MKQSTLIVPLQKLLALLLATALSSACAALDARDTPRPGDNEITPHLPVDKKLTEALESKDIKMVITIDKDGKFNVVDTQGRLLEGCKDTCSGLRNVTVEVIESPVVLKTTRNPKCIVWVENGTLKEKCW